MVDAVDDKGVVSSKDYDIKTLELINSGAQSIDLRKIFVELQIYQDIFTSVMSGSILIMDGHDIFSNFYFCGNEYLRISIDKPTLGKPLEKTFRIYRSDARTPSSDAGQTYLLYFCSDELILSNSKLVSKAYASKKTSDIIVDVLVNELKVDRTKIGYIESTSGVYDYVVPNKRPLEVIQWAVSRSYDSSPKYNYFFYEDRDGYNLISYSSMIKKKIIKTLKYEKKTVDQDPAVNKDSIDKFEIKNDFDVLTSLSNGAFASKLLTVDIFGQQFKYYNYSVDVAEAQSNLMNKFKPINSLKNQDNKPITSVNDSFFRTYVGINDTASERSNDVSKWMMNRALHMALMHNFSIKVIIPGDIFLKAGDMVKYEFPNFEGADSSGKRPNEYRTGNYLVSAINHKFTGGEISRFESVVELVSDSVSKQIPQAKESLNKVVSKSK